jgi:diguanylate cyclase (GGDEF)-like protein
MSEDAIVQEGHKLPSPEVPPKVPDPEISECLEFVKNNPPEIVAKELARLRQEALWGGKDFLTGVKNRKGLEQDLPLIQAMAQRAGDEEPKEIMICEVDLDDLKEVNDSEGHDKGDEALINCAQAILRSVRGTDVVARTGGDEFAVLCLVKGIEDGEIIKENIRKELKDLRASIGYTIWQKDEKFQEAYKRADAKMYMDKRERKKPKTNV